MVTSQIDILNFDQIEWLVNFSSRWSILAADCPFLSYKNDHFGIPKLTNGQFLQACFLCMVNFSGKFAAKIDHLLLKLTIHLLNLTKSVAKIDQWIFTYLFFSAVFCSKSLGINLNNLPLILLILLILHLFNSNY